MDSFADDDFHNVIQLGIKDDLTFCLEHGRYRAATLLFYAGIDAVTQLSLPPGSERASGKDYQAWSSRYVLKGPLSEIKPFELYGGRCAALHDYGTSSDASEKKGGRQIAISDYDSKIVVAEPSANLVIASLTHLIASFFMGLDEFAINSFSSPATKDLVEHRLTAKFMQFPAANVDHGTSHDDRRTIEDAKKELLTMGWSR